MQMTIDIPIVRPPKLYSLRIWSPATTILGLLVIANSARIPRCGVEVVHVISSVAVLFQDFFELLAIYLRKRTIAVVEISLIVLAFQAVQASRLLAASAELGTSGKKSHCGV
jgi:hypothetical protein